MTTGFYLETVIAAILLLFASCKADFKEDFVGKHNQYRRTHRVPPLVLVQSYLQDCEKYAQLVSSKADFNKNFVGKHNKYRLKHQVQPLVLDESHSKNCEKYARELAAANRLEHSDPKGKYGENLCFTASDPLNCVSMWYDEIKYYDFADPRYSKATGHFTQLVWKNSKFLAVGKAENSYGHYVVARYYPAGNLAGEFAYNVLDSSAFRSSNLSKISKLLIWLLPALLLQDFMQK